MKNTNMKEGSLVDDMTVDLLIVGSGIGLSAALAGHEKGLKTLVIEKTAYVGGSTALSGGAFWIPANPVLKDGGSDDNLEKAETYLETIVGDDTPPARWHSFLNHGSATVEMLLRTTPMKFFWSKGYSDYHPEIPGGDALGRTCECRPFNIKRLGKDLSNFRPGLMVLSLPMPVTGYDYKWMNLMLRKPLKAFPLIFKRLFQGIGGMLMGKKLVAGGQALAAGLYAGALNADVPVVTNTKLVELVLERKRVVGAIVEQNGKKVTVNVKRGVVLAAGGFDHNMPMRQQYQSESLVDDLSFGAEGNTGDAIVLSQELGADIDLMKQAWWFPAIAPIKSGETPQVLLAERSLPGSFMVNGKGHRFINEAINYMSTWILRLEKSSKLSPIDALRFE